MDKWIDNRLRISLSWAVFAFVAIAFGFFYFTVPPMEDDILFFKEMLDMGTNADGSVDFWQGWKDSISNRYLTDNARLANVVGELMLLLPHWLGIAPIVACVVFGFWLMPKLAEIRRENPVQMAFLAVLFVFLPVWGDKMSSLIFAYNYVVEIPLTVGCMLLFFSPRKVNPALAFILGLVAGTWHESMPIFLLAGAFAVFVFRRDMLRADRIWLLSGLLLGFCYLYCAPAWQFRMKAAAKFHESEPKVAIYFDSFLILLGLCLICLCKKKFRHLVKSPLVIFTLFGSAMLIVPVVMSGRPRPAWPGMIACCCAIAWLLFRMCPRFFSCKSVKGNVCVGLLFAFTALHMIALNSYALTLRKELPALNEALIRDEKVDRKGQIFLDLTYTWETPWFTFRRPNHQIHIFWETEYLYRKRAFHPSPVRVIPTELRDFSPEKAKPVSGSPGLWNYKGEIVSTNLEYRHVGGATTHFGRWQEWTPIHANSFQADNGETYVYFQTMRSMVSNYLGEPTEIWIPDQY